MLNVNFKIYLAFFCKYALKFKTYKDAQNKLYKSNQPFVGINKNKFVISQIMPTIKHYNNKFCTILVFTVVFPKINYFKQPQLEVLCFEIWINMMLLDRYDQMGNK